MEKLNRAQKCSILGPQNLGSGGPGPQGPPGSAPVSFLLCQSSPFASCLVFLLCIALLKQRFDPLKAQPTCAELMTFHCVCHKPLGPVTLSFYYFIRF